MPAPKSECKKPRYRWPHVAQLHAAFTPVAPARSRYGPSLRSWRRFPAAFQSRQRMIQATESKSTVEQIHPDREANAIATLTLAFAEDPANRWCWPGSSEYLTAFPSFARALGGRAF